MNIVKQVSYLSSFFALIAVPAFAGVTVSSPYNGETVSSPFTLSASASACSSQSIASMGYSFDNSPNTTIIKNSAINVSAQTSAGAHTLHVKSWGTGGASCVTDVAINVTGVTSAVTKAASAPSGSASVSSIQVLSNWKAQHDPGTSGSSSGSMSVVSSPTYSGKSRKFVTKYSGSGGELYYVTYGDDTSSTNFLYDGWVYIGGSAASLANIEMDMNQVMANGQTVIYGFQCDGWAGTWDYTKNAGSPTKPKDTWVHSGAACNPRTWSLNAWHHVQISYSRNSSGVVTYHSVSLDGAQKTINATVPSAFALGWAPTLITNFQIDGSGSGTATVYLDDLKISRW